MLFVLGALGRYRPLFLAGFAVAGLLSVASLLALNKQLFLWGAYFAHLALVLFLLTEAFGPISQTRTLFSRIVARTFLALAVVVVLGMTLSLAIGGARALN